MIDYEYYINKYDGKKITNEESFNACRDKAIRYINFVTSKQGSEKEIADAVCALCDLYSETDGSEGVERESVDGVSITYRSEKTEKRAYSILKLYLPQRLLYRGI